MLISGFLTFYIERNFAAHLSVEIIAEKIGYHPYYLGAAFRKSTGVGVIEYINSVRIRSAEELLLHTDEPISVIAERCGFESADRFGFVFKKQNKITKIIKIYMKFALKIGSFLAR